MLTRSDIVNRVKARLDELVPFDEGSIVLPTNELLRPIHALIESELDNATLELLERAPLYLLTAYEHNLYSLAIGDDKVAYLNMPDDFLRLALLWLRGWHRPVQSAISRENPMYKLQRNAYTRGGNAKPVAVLADDNPLLTARWSGYQCQREMRDFAEANTGYEVALILTINEHSFSPLNAFDSYPELSIERFIGQGEPSRLLRVAAFMAYMSRLLGVDIYKLLDKDTPDRRENSQACNILDGIAYIQVSVNNPSWGEAKASGWYSIGSTIYTDSAPSNTGVFLGWYENGVLVSSEATYSFTVTGNRSLTAKFRIVQLEVILKSEDTARGTANGGGKVDAGESVSISAEAKDGWAFDAWYYNGVARREDIPQNGVFKPTEGCTLVAYFKKKEATVTAKASSQNLGTATGGGTFEIGTTCTVEAEPIGCYRFVEWRDSTGKVVSTDPTYSFTVEEDVTLTAIFEVVYATVNVTCNAEQGSATVNGSSSVTVARCTYVDLKAEAKNGYIFGGWQINGVVQPLLGATASYKAEDDVTLEAVFYKPAIYVGGIGYDTMNPYENHKYYGGATLSQAISCTVTAYCWIQVGGQTFEYSATIYAGDTASAYTLVYESIPDPDLRDCGCCSVSITECDGHSIEANPGHKP